MRFDFELGDPSHLNAVLRSLKRIDSVYEVYRVMPGKGG
jgi:GTP pyrophosphokinase